VVPCVGGNPFRLISVNENKKSLPGTQKNVRQIGPASLVFLAFEKADDWPAPAGLPFLFACRRSTHLGATANRTTRGAYDTGLTAKPAGPQLAPSFSGGPPEWAGAMKSPGEGRR